MTYSSGDFHDKPYILTQNRILVVKMVSKETMNNIRKTYDTSHYSWTSWVSYGLLEDELIKIMQYIPPDKKNMQTWSPHLANLLIIICTRLDSFFKASVRSNIWSFIEPEIPNFPKKALDVFKKSKRDWNIINYLRFFDPLFDLKSLDVCFKPHDLAARSPFCEWQNSESPSWWTTYNDVKHDYYSNMSFANLECVINAFAAYFIIFLLYPESLATLAFAKGVLKTVVHLPSGIISNKQSEIRIRKIEELEQNDPNDPKIQKMKRYLSYWKNTIPPYPFMTNKDHKFTAESKLFLFFFRNKAYEWFRENVGIVDPHNYFYLADFDPSPI